MSNQEYKQKLEKHIDNSGLDDNSKEMWGIFIRIASPEEAEAVYEAVAASRDNLDLLNQHLGDKIQDMDRSHGHTWRDYVENENEGLQIY